jgi:hypothetical protein
MQPVYEGIGRRLSQNPCNSADRKGNAYPLLVPAVAGQVDRAATSITQATGSNIGGRLKYLDPSGPLPRCRVRAGSVGRTLTENFSKSDEGFG